MRLPNAILAISGIIALLSLGPLQAQEELVSLTPRDYWIITLTSGEQIPGQATISDDGTETVRFKATNGKVQLFQRDEYRRLDPPMTVADIIKHNGAILLKNPKRDRVLEVRRLIKFGLEKGEQEVARDLSLQAVKVYPKDLMLAEDTIELLKGEKGHIDTLVGIAENGLKVNPSWNPGYRAKAEALKLKGQDKELFDFIVHKWLPRNSTDAAANDYLAPLAEKMGRPDLAMEAYRKKFVFHKDMNAGVGYARAALLSGDADAAAKAAATLVDKGIDTPLVDTILGTDSLRKGDAKTAVKKLQNAVEQGGMGPELMMIATYNLGVAYYKSGNKKKAETIWSGVKHPAATVATAIAKGKPIANSGKLEGPLADIAKEHNICLDLSRQRYEQVTGKLDPGNPRHTFLGQIAKMLANAGSKESVAALKLNTTWKKEAQHWVLYAHFISGRNKELQAALDAMPEKDGYAGVLRVYMAGLDKDMDRARMLFEALAGSTDAPKDYVNKLAAEFAASNDEIREFDFSDWAEGSQLRTGWDSQADGTGISVEISKRRLVLAGTQTPAEDPVSRAWCMQAPQKLRRVEVDLDIKDVGGATVGLELLDQNRRNGIAYGIDPSAKLVWRQLTGGVWGQWTSLNNGVDGSQVQLVLTYDHRTDRVMVELPGGRLQAVGRNVSLSNGLVGVGVFGTASSGEEWRLEGKRLAIQLTDPGMEERFR